MELKTFIRRLPIERREEFAVKCKTTIGHLRNVMYGYKPCATELAVRIERESGLLVRRQELRSDWADHWPELAQALANQGQGVTQTAAQGA